MLTQSQARLPFITSPLVVWHTVTFSENGHYHTGVVNVAEVMEQMHNPDNVAYVAVLGEIVWYFDTPDMQPVARSIDFNDSANSYTDLVAAAVYEIVEGFGDPLGDFHGRNE